MNKRAPVLQEMAISGFGGSGDTPDLSEDWPYHLVSFSVWGTLPSPSSCSFPGVPCHSVLEMARH